MSRSPLRQAARTSERRPARSTAAPPDLLALLAGGGEVSGADVAVALGITRAAVWKQIEQLRAHGLAVHAEAGRGYRLEAPIELLDASAHRRRDRSRTSAHASARSTCAGRSIRRAASSHARPKHRRRRARASPKSRPPAAAVAAATGRRRSAGGLALSFVRRFDGGMAALSGLSLVAGIAVLRALADTGIEGAALKWPNDIVANGRKLGGILVELGGDALGPCRAIVGIGINVRIGSGQGAAIDQPWTDLATLGSGTSPSRNAVAGRILARLAEALDGFAAAGFAAFEREYARHDALRGREVVVASGSERWTAIADGVTSRGALRVVRDGGAIESRQRRNQRARDG